MRVTIERWVCLTASGSSRVVPEVYWKIASASERVAGSKRAGNRARLARKSSSATTRRGPSIDDRRAAFSALVTSSAGEQSSTRSFTPSGPKSVNSGTAIAPSFIVPKTAV